jgi:hypothetical protein
MTLSPELLAELQAVDSDWQLIPCDDRKRPIDPATGEPMTAWASHATDADGIAALAASPYVKAVGMVLGEPSGVIAIDFDGTGSTDVFRSVYGLPWTELPKTVGWCSGLPNRRQLAFRVPMELWPNLRNRRVWKNSEGRTALELRGNGHQSVIVGAHPDTAGYQWLPGRSPADLQVADAPDWLLAPLLKAASEPADTEHQPSAADVPRALELLAHIKPRDDYDGWLKVGMALHSVDPGLLCDWLGWSRGCANFDEEECLAKWTSFKSSGFTIGTLHYLAELDGFRYVKPEPEYDFPDHGDDASKPPPRPIEVPKDQQIQALLDELLDLMLQPQESWAKQMATRAALWALGVQGGAIDERLYYALAQRWGLSLQTSHAGGSRNRKLSDPIASPAEDLLPGFLLWRRDHLLFGAGGTGKTLAAAQMAVCLIKGLPFLDQQIPPSRTGRVLWIGTDGGEGARAMVKEYIEDLGLEHDDPDIEANLNIWAAEGDDALPSWACTPSGLKELRDELESGGYALVVVDSLKATLELAGVNFSIGPVGTLMRLMQALVGRYCSLLWLHHPAGGKAAGKGLQAAAGSQNINQIPSAVHQITRKVEDRGPSNLWSVHKLRGSTSREFSYRLAEAGFEITDGQITANVRVAVLDAIELLNAGGMPSGTSYIASNLATFNDSTIRNNLTWLRKRGLIRKKGSDWDMTPAGTDLLDDVKHGKRDQIK